MNSSGVGKRKRFSFAEKYEILKELDAGAKRPFLERKHSISHGTPSWFLEESDNYWRVHSKCLKSRFEEHKAVSIPEDRRCTY